MSSNSRYDLVIVGMGSGGMVAADLAATVGVKVAVVERERIGGDCLWTGCVPSKALLAAGKVAQHMREAGRFGIEPVEPVVRGDEVFARIRAVQEEIREADDNAERYTSKGVEVIFGAGRIAGPNAVAVGERTLETRFILLTTGSRPAVPDIPGLADAGFLTSETVWDLERIPASVVIVGGGPIAAELAQGLNRLGAEVTVLQRSPRLLPRDEPALAETLTEVLREEGVTAVLGAEAARVSRDGPRRVVHGAGGETWSGEELVVAAGRRPNVDGLGLAEAGIAVAPRGIVTDTAMRTSVDSIYAAGDLAGRHLFTHSAGYEGARAVRNMLFPGREKGDVAVPWCTFTDPELAHVGLTTAEARDEHGADAVQVYRQPLTHSDRARTDGATAGEVVIVTAKGRVVGGHILAPAAGEAIHELVLAIRERLKLSELASMVHVYPTLSTGIQLLSAEAAVESAARFSFLVKRGRTSKRSPR